MNELFTMKAAALDALFATLASGPLPDGRWKGTVLLAGGTFLARPIAWVARALWQGKEFNGARGVLRNRLAFGVVRAIVATVYLGPSWFDGQACIVLDYSETSLVAHWLRDEIRLVSEGLYLGKVYVARWPVMHFALSGAPRRP